MTCKEEQSEVVEWDNNQCISFGINVNGQHDNGLTPFDLDVHLCLLDSLDRVG